MGDINEWKPTSNLLRHLNKLMKKVPCGATFPSFRPLLRLDRVWHDSPFKVTARVLREAGVRGLSDHLPLIIEAAR
jgi:endonuclease/exonuclease/phosphatase family metal-dependent hydrolase